MYLSKRSNGIYYVFYPQSNGKLTCISTKERIKSEALKFLSNFQREVKARKESKAFPIPMRQFFNEFLKYSESVHSPKHTESLKATFSKFIHHTGNPLLSELKKENFIQYKETRLKEVSEYTVKRDIANLSSLFNWGISKGYLRQNLVQGIKKPKLPEKQPLFFDEISFEILLQNINSKDLSDLVLFAVNSGLRQGELIRLEWSQINIKDRFLILDNRNSLTKSKKVRTVPLNLKALQILTERGTNRKGSKVFLLNGDVINPDKLSRLFKKYIIKAGLNPQLKFHSLRHTFASWLVQKGVSIFEVSKLLGHSDIRVTEIYSHLRADDLLNSVNKLND